MTELASNTAIGTPFLISEGVDIFLDEQIDGEAALFVIGGRAPTAPWLAHFCAMNSPEVWAVDSGIAACRAASVKPAAIIGDMDSANSTDVEWARSAGAAEHRYDKAKNLTDFQLSLDMCRCSGPHFVTGCFGGRFDHLISAADTIAASPYTSCMIDDVEGMFFLRATKGAQSTKRVVLRFKHPMKAVSLLSVSPFCTGVSIAGTRWPIPGDTTLSRAYPWAISNEVDGDGTVYVGCEEGTLAVYWCRDERLC